MGKGGVHPGSENLIPLDRRSPEARAAITSAGGRASGAAKRRRRAMREAVGLLLSMPAGDEQLKELLNQLGVDEAEQTNQMAMIVALFSKALKGDTAAATFLRDTGGDKPKDKQERSNTARIILEGSIQDWSK